MKKILERQGFRADTSADQQSQAAHENEQMEIESTIAIDSKSV